MGAATQRLAVAAALLLMAAPAEARNPIVALGPRVSVVTAGLPGSGYYPDGHVSVIPEQDFFQIYWAESSTYRTLTDRRSYSVLAPLTPVIGPGPPGSFDNHGAWLYSVFRRSANELIGFYHGEDTEWPGDPGEHFIAWKSAAFATSLDDGASWTKQGQILTAPSAKPSQPTWGGDGDFSVVRDEANARWAMLFTEAGSIGLAISADPDGRPGTWVKYWNGDFTEPGLGGRSSPVLGSGGNPSVHWNTHLRHWVAVWHSWDFPPSRESIWLSTSSDLIRWDPPTLVIAPGPGERLWYPTIIGDSDQVAGRVATLAYAYFPDRNLPTREFVTHTIEIDECTAIDDPACDDGDPCTVDVCSNGACSNQLVPRTDCHAPAAPRSTHLVLRAGSPDRHLLTWAAKNQPAAGLVDFGDPRRDTSYTVCAYDRSASGAELLLRASAPAAGLCADRPCWRAIGGATPRGFEYRDRTRAADGIERVTLRLEPNAPAKMQIRAKGPRLALPSAPAIEPPVTLQLHASNGQCWEATYESVTRKPGDRIDAK